MGHKSQMILLGWSCFFLKTTRNDAKSDDGSPMGNLFYICIYVQEATEKIETQDPWKNPFEFFLWRIPDYINHFQAIVEYI